MMRPILILLLIAVAVFGFTLWRNFGRDAGPVGAPVADFTLTDVRGETFRLSDYRGKVVLIDFWGFW